MPAANTPTTTALTAAQTAKLDHWWNSIQTESTALKIRYFLRNETAIRSDITDDSGWLNQELFLDYLGTRSSLKRYSQNPDVFLFTEKAVRDFSISGEQFEISVRRMIIGKFERLVIEWMNARTPETTDWVAIPV